jgi:hypothetical protein
MFKVKFEKIMEAFFAKSFSDELKGVHNTTGWQNSWNLKQLKTVKKIVDI